MSQPNLAAVFLAHRETKTDTVGTGSEVGVAGFAFTAELLANAQGMMVTAGANPFRYTCDGTTPTSDLGHYVAANETVVIYGNANVNNYQSIGITGDGIQTATLLG